MRLNQERIKVLQENPYEQLYRKPLTKEKVTEMKFNLVGYLKTLIEMDKQYQEWLKEKDGKELHVNDSK